MTEEKVTSLSYIFAYSTFLYILATSGMTNAAIGFLYLVEGFVFSLIFYIIFLTVVRNLF